MKARAVVVRTPGGPEVLELAEVDVRDPGPGEIRVRVRAAGVNRADLLQRRGLYPPPPGSPPDVLGLEFAGEVEACGPGTSLHRPGDRVMGLVGSGGMSELVCVHEREAVSIPRGMDFAAAAAIPEAFMTAYDALFLQAKASMGDRVLIHAVASGVGTAAVQLVRAAGARSIGTSRSEAKLRAVQGLGLDEPLLVEEGKFAERCLALTGGRGVDVLLDFVGASYLAENIASLAPGGRMVVLGLMGGVLGEMSLGLLLSRRLAMMGSTLRARPLEEKIALSRVFEAHVVPLFEAGVLRPVVDRTFAAAEVRAAHERMESNENVGKMVVVFG